MRKFVLLFSALLVIGAFSFLSCKLETNPEGNSGEPSYTSIANVTNVSVTPGDKTITVTWTPSTDQNVKYIVISAKPAGSSENDKNNKTVALQSNIKSYTFSGLTNDVYYYITVKTWDGKKVYSSAVTKTATPKEPEPEPQPQSPVILEKIILSIDSENINESDTFLDPYILKLGDSHKINVTLTPAEFDINKLNWTWSSDCLDFDKKTLTVTAKEYTTCASIYANVNSSENNWKYVSSNSLYFKVPKDFASVKLDGTSDTLSLYYSDNMRSLYLTPKYYDEEGDLLDSNIINVNEASWSSSDESVATVTNGKVLPIGAGTAKITYTADDKTAEYTVKVIDKVVKISSVRFVKNSMDVALGEVFTPEIKIEPENANTKVKFRIKESSDWDSEDSDMFIENEDGTFVATKTGTAYFFVTYNITESGYTRQGSSCAVNVHPKATDFELPAEVITLNYGKTYTLNITVPDGEKYISAEFESSNENVIISESGKISSDATAADGLVESIITVKVDDFEPKQLKVIFCELPGTEKPYFIKGEMNISVGSIFEPEYIKKGTMPIEFKAFKDIIASEESDLFTETEDGKLQATGTGTAYFYLSWIEGTSEMRSSVMIVNIRNPATDFEISGEDHIGIDFSKSYQITLTPVPSDGAFSSDMLITYSSSNANIVIDEDGRVSCMNSSDIQESVISVKVGDFEEKTINIKFYRIITGIQPGDDLLIVKKNDSVTIPVTIFPADASYKDLEWVTADDTVAVFENGKIKGISDGFVKFVTERDGVKAEINAVVLSAAGDFSVATKDQLKKLSNGYITDAAGLVAYKYTTAAHASATRLEEGVGKWDIMGNQNGTWKSSTYKNAGWGYAINNYIVSLNENGETALDDVKLKVRPFIVYNRGIPFVLFVNILTNTGTTDLTNQYFGSATDVQIANNDEAPVNAVSYGANLIDSNTNMVFSLNCLSGDAVTPVDSVWIGNYSSCAIENVYTNNHVSVSGIDSAIAYSWQHIDLKAGESKVFTVRLTFVVDQGGTLDALVY